MTGPDTRQSHLSLVVPNGDRAVRARNEADLTQNGAQGNPQWVPFRVGPSASLASLDLLSGSGLEKSGLIGVDPICERI